MHERSCDRFLLPFIEGKGNFTPSKDVYDEDEEVTLQCDEGFSPLVNDFAVCIDGFFVPNDFACVERVVGKRCGHLPLVEGSGGLEPQKAVYDEYDEIYLNCSDGYEPYEDHVSVCLNGRFYPDFLICEKIGEYRSDDEGCDNSTLPFINGPGSFLPHKSRYEQGDVVTLECAQGYLAQAEGALAFCHSGYFDPYIATCVKVGCEKETLPVVEGEGYVQPLLQSYDDQYEVVLECGEGFLRGNHHVSTCRDGRFQPSTLYCLPTKCTMEMLPYIIGPGRFEPMKEVYDKEEQVELVCGAGYQPESHNSTTCFVGGEFYPMFLSCVKTVRGCPAASLPMIIGPGTLTDDELKEWYLGGEKVKVVCESGYGVIRFTNSAQCDEETGQFYPYTIKCRRNRKNMCWDKTPQCERWAIKGRCDEERFRRRCRISCGVCTE